MYKLHVRVWMAVVREVLPREREASEQLSYKNNVVFVIFVLMLESKIFGG